MKALVTKDIATSEGSGVIKAGSVIEVTPELFKRYFDIGKVVEVKEEKVARSTKEQKFVEPKTKTDIVEPKDVD
jgi:endonuclease III